MEKWCGTIEIKESIPVNGLYLVDTRICDREVGASSALTYRQYITAVNYVVSGDELTEFQTEMNSWGWDTIGRWLLEADMFIKDFNVEGHRKLVEYIEGKGWDW